MAARGEASILGVAGAGSRKKNVTKSPALERGGNGAGHVTPTKPRPRPTAPSGLLPRPHRDRPPRSAAANESARIERGRFPRQPWRKAGEAVA